MTAAQRSPWSAPLRLALAGGGSVLVLVEGTAGMGKSHVLHELDALPEAAEVRRARWRCGAAEEPPDTADGPALLLVDDVHRATPDERQWLRRAVERPREGLATVLAYRPEELGGAGLPLGTPAVSYPPGLAAFRHRLRAWDVERVRLAASETLVERATWEAVARLHLLSGGVPQVVTDLLAVLRAGTGPRCTAADVDAAGVPVRLAELVMSRTGALAAADRPVVWAAGVLDEPADRGELLAVAGLDGTRGRDALLAALSGAVLSEVAEGRYGFAVPLAAPAVREHVPGPVRQELHERAARVLSRRRPAPWAEVARHRRAAGRRRSWLRAVEKAARTAVESGRHQEAIGLLERTLAVPEVSPVDRARLAPLLARSAVVGLRSDQTVDVLTQVVRDPGLPVDVRGELRLDLGLMLYNQIGDLAAGVRELEAAAEELSEVRPTLAARAMVALAMPEWPTGALPGHREWLRRAAGLARDSGNDVARAAVAASRASLAVVCGDPRARQLVAALPVDSTSAGCREQAVRGLCNAADAAVWRGSYHWGRELLAASLDLSARTGALYAEQTAQGTRLLLDWWTGQWTELGARCEQFIARAADMPVVAADGHMVRGMLAFAQGDWAEALRWLTALGAPSPQCTRMPLAAATAGALVRLALARDDLPAAADQARSAWAAVADKGIWTWAAELAPWAVEALARSGDTEGARHLVVEFEQGLAGDDASAAHAAAAWSRAALAECEGRRREAVRSYRKAAAAYRTLPRPYAWALTTEGAARCALAQEAERADADGGPAQDRAGEPDGANGANVTDGAAGDGRSRAHAVAALRHCVDEYTALGAVYDTARARALLRAHQPAEARRPGRPALDDRLSPREREVAELAASGLMNREIAVVLHLSPRTVEQHVARAIRKTGALSRRDLLRTSGEPQ
ncbi:LuxR C-terminal-related transcriptional regulator [Streptomyces sp. NPDC003703]|uniref:helix-turn-helix transcriptional regulator n=1 Tax=Streptomyces sp. NPDC003283 TaxID=3364681 RepID=UPI00368E27D5